MKRPLFQILKLLLPKEDLQNSERNVLFKVDAIVKNGRTDLQQISSCFRDINVYWWRWRIGYFWDQWKQTWRIIMPAKMRMDHATKYDVLISIDPFSVRTSLRTAQKPIHAPVNTTKASRNIANCNSQFWYTFQFLNSLRILISYCRRALHFIKTTWI